MHNEPVIHPVYKAINKTLTPRYLQFKAFDQRNPTYFFVPNLDAYLRAFGQATRTQLRAYLEALLADVEREWGSADPAGVPQEPYRTPAQRSDSVPATFVGNTAGESAPVDDVAAAGARSA